MKRKSSANRSPVPAQGEQLRQRHARPDDGNAFIPDPGDGPAHSTRARREHRRRSTRGGHSGEGVAMTSARVTVEEIGGLRRRHAPRGVLQPRTTPTSTASRAQPACASRFPPPHAPLGPAESITQSFSRPIPRLPAWPRPTLRSPVLTYGQMPLRCSAAPRIRAGSTTINRSTYRFAALVCPRRCSRPSQSLHARFRSANKDACSLSELPPGLVVPAPSLHG